MDVFFIGETIMAVITKLGSGGWGGIGMVFSISFVAKLTSIITLDERTVNIRTGGQVSMTLFSQAGGPRFDRFRRLAFLGEQSRGL